MFSIQVTNYTSNYIWCLSYQFFFLFLHPSTPPIWSLCGRYASYWNAFLLEILYLNSTLCKECFELFRTINNIGNCSLRQVLWFIHTDRDRQREYYNGCHNIHYQTNREANSNHCLPIFIQ